MELLANHVVLAEGDDEQSCRRQVIEFFEKTSLVRYDKIVVEDRAPMAADPVFKEELSAAVEQNRRTLQRFIEELGSTGFASRSDLERVAQGYHSKILHIIAHFLDGFIGIDSAFYNLVDDSHWLSEQTQSNIAEVPERFRLLFLKCYSLTPREAALLHM